MSELPISIELEQEVDGRWIAEVPLLPGVVVYGKTIVEAEAAVRALALRVLADRVEHGEPVPDSVAELFAVQS
ncbi:MAG: type II toxin-antitoxin system HicB family antitoxin [Zavarzinella sp.]